MFDRNYYHWLVDTLPRLYLFASLRLAEPITLLMPAGLKPYQIASLNCCLPANMTVEYVKDCDRVWVEKLLMPSYIRARTNLYVPVEHLNYVRSAILRSVDLSTSRNHKSRIYISRALASRRRVVNEDEVVACLSKYGFAVVRTETMTLEEQVDCFRAAEWIVGPHGAGLANILFAENVRIIEFLGDLGPSAWHFQRLASTLGHVHHYLTVKQRAKDADMYVDIGSLERKLVECGS
jgi:capsular polysaccharide biosynthesis protein